MHHGAPDGLNAAQPDVRDKGVCRAGQTGLGPHVHFKATHFLKEEHMAQAQAKKTEAPKETKRITAVQLAETLKHFSGVDSIELKVTIDAADQRSTFHALEMDPLQARIRQVLFFDTPDLQLNKAGVVVRSRRIQDKPADSVIKLRPITPSEAPPKLRATPNFSIELDVMPDGYVCSGSMKNVSISDNDVKDVMAGRKPIRKLFTKEQRALYAAHAPKGLDIDALSILGPITLLKLKFAPSGLNQKLVAELWFYPDGSRILELSTKALVATAPLVAREVRAFMQQRGVKGGASQSTKTRSALDYFSKQLQG